MNLNLMKVYIAHPEMGEDNGVGQVLKYHKEYLPQVGVKLVKNPKNADIIIDHLGVYPDADIHFSHGVWFGPIDNGKAQQNANIIEVIKRARAVIVPSSYVAMTFKRDLRMTPYVIGHGVEYSEWQESIEKRDVILWNKNRASKVCDPGIVTTLAGLLPEQQFITTFATEKLPNLQVVGVMSFEEMKPLIMSSKIYLATAKETFGIGTLEAMASGNPVLAFDYGGTKDIVTHKKDGYLVKPGDINGLVKGAKYIIMNYDRMSAAAKETAWQYTWMRVAEQIKEVCIAVLKGKR